MGLFDAFTGDPAKKAAAANTARLEASKTAGMGYLDAGKTGALGALDDAAANYAPLTALSQKYGAGTDLYLDALGVNGAEGNTRATDAYHAAPGFNYTLDTSLDALDRRAASKGMLASGNNTIDTLTTATGLADQGYNNWLSSLGGLVSPEVSATSGAATGLAGVDTNKANIWTNDANSRVGLETGTTTGINSQATQAANAQMAGNGNMWNFGLNVAKLGTSMLGGSAGGGG